jgi:pyridoxal/pyridoxine/pyridoxamine kinase
MNPPRLVCVHSLTAHGVVGLKPFLHLLGPLCLPVPSVLLTGPGDMPGVRRQAAALASLLDGALAALDPGDSVVLVVGYLANAAQLDAVVELVATHRARIRELVVDPISGDEGRPYVAPELIAAWPRLVALADWALPNHTELSLLTARPGPDAVAAWRERFPSVNLLVTGWPESGSLVGTRLYPVSGDAARSAQPREPGRHNGSGDLFAALWLRARLVAGLTPAAAAECAAAGVRSAILAATAAGTRELHPVFIRP